MTTTDARTTVPGDVTSRPAALADCESCGAAGSVARVIEIAPFIYGSGPDAVVFSPELPVMRCSACADALTDHEAEAIRDGLIAARLAESTERL